MPLKKRGNERKPNHFEDDGRESVPVPNPSEETEAEAQRIENLQRYISRAGKVTPRETRLFVKNKP